MIDIHAHILPHLDDGSDSTQTSLRMAELAVESGVTDLIATPHSNQRGKYENYASPELKEQYYRLKDLLREFGLPLHLHPGMEVYGTPEVPKLLRDGKLITLAGSRYLLIEFGFHEEPYEMEQVLRGVHAQGVTPIVAHPERYYALQAVPDILYDWVRGGTHLQINKGSLTGFFGRDAYQLAITMLEHDLVSFAASDAHGTHRRTPVLADTWRWLEKYVSARRAQRLLEENPKRVLADAPLLDCRPVPFR